MIALKAHQLKLTIKIFIAVVLLPWTYLRVRHLQKTVTKIELGSGGKKRAGWLTMDLVPGADVIWDLRWRLPLDESSVDVIYCEHVLEHLSFREVKELFGDIRRVLKPGGKFLISVPDLDIYLEAYGAGDTRLLTFAPAITSNQKADILNYIFYMNGEHRFMYNFDSLAFHLRANGFTDVRKRTFDPTLDDAGRLQESLYVSCSKAA